MMAIATFLLVAVLLVSGLVGYHPGTYTKAVFLASLAWGVLSNLIGIRVVDGWRHLVLNTAGCAAINIAVVVAARLIAH
jgi:membrane protein DedA with SNARE-associated domain